jgi:hypothetical protein
MVDDLVAFVHSSEHPNPLYQKLFDLNESLERKKLDYVLKKAPTLEDDVLGLMKKKSPKIQLPTQNEISDFVEKNMRLDSELDVNDYKKYSILVDYIRPIIQKGYKDKDGTFASAHDHIKRINNIVGQLIKGKLTKVEYACLLELNGDDLSSHLQKYRPIMSKSNFLKS